MVKWCLWSALPHICITSAFIQNKTCFPVPVGILSSKLLLWLLSFHNSYSLPSSLLLFWYSLVYFLQWMATRGLRWSPYTPHWSSALRAHRLRWAQPWRRPWGPLKTLCSHPSPKSRTESPDQARSQPGIFLFSFFGLLSKWRNLEGVFSTRLDSTHALQKCTDVNSTVTWSNPRWTAISRLPQTAPLTPTFMHIFICFSCELIMGQPPTPPLSHSYRLAALAC